MDSELYLTRNSLFVLLSVSALTIDLPIRVTNARITTESPSQILLIRHLVRPFTISQLKTLLLTYGKLVEDQFWNDKLRSQCFVKVSISVLSISVFKQQ